jgi:septum formation protein
MTVIQMLSRPLILASGSPRRKEILEKMGYTFSVITGEEIDEQSLIDADNLERSLENLALAKARSVAETHPEALVLSADTIVVQERHILGKPDNREHAAEMLRSLSGVRHSVITAVALSCSGESFYRAITALTHVFFRDLSSDEIRRYLEGSEPYDKAGAYGIQGAAMVFVDKIEGCFYNVVGLPVSRTIDLFKAFKTRKEPRNVARN